MLNRIIITMPDTLPDPTGEASLDAHFTHLEPLLELLKHVCRVFLYDGTDRSDWVHVECFMISGESAAPTAAKPFDVPIFCGDRFCPVCSCVRQSRVRSRLGWLIENRQRQSGYDLKHVTLTIASQKDLAPMVRTIGAAFRRLRQRAFWKQRVAGGAFVIEVTGRPGSWHAHIHAICDSKWLPWEHLLKIWKTVSKGQGVYIQRIPEARIINYLTKYLSKPEAPPDVTDDILAALKGVRLFAPFGSWHSLNKRYVKPKMNCKKCGAHSWELTYVMGLSSDFKFTKEVNLGDVSPPTIEQRPLQSIRTGNSRI